MTRGAQEFFQMALACHGMRKPFTSVIGLITSLKITLWGSSLVIHRDKERRIRVKSLWAYTQGVSIKEIILWWQHDWLGRWAVHGVTPSHLLLPHTCISNGSSLNPCFSSVPSHKKLI